MTSESKLRNRFVAKHRELRRRVAHAQMNVLCDVVEDEHDTTQPRGPFAEADEHRS